ncbi:MAG: hypothetical protein K2Y04_04520 [Caulobacteraceae bacterium]|nr:hypothetical protein [Caulobacteraceae bacterium]
MALTWSDNGNLLSQGSTTYEWMFGNRLARVLKPGSTAEYAYDSQVRRTVVIEDGVMTRTLWSGSDEVGEYDHAGGLKRRFIPDGSGSMDARLATVNPDNTIYWSGGASASSQVGVYPSPRTPIRRGISASDIPRAIGISRRCSQSANRRFDFAEKSLCAFRE